MLRAGNEDKKVFLTSAIKLPFYGGKLYNQPFHINTEYNLALCKYIRQYIKCTLKVLMK